MNVELLSYTENPVGTCVRAAQTCYNSYDENNPLTPIAEEGYINGVIKSGHLSVLEHASFTFKIEGVSRALSHQLVRHRIASFSQQSQRYVRMDEPTYVTPPLISGEGYCYTSDLGTTMREAKKQELFEHAMCTAWDVYKALVTLGVPAEDARFVLPNACTTELVMTMNARELHHFFNLRCCNRAQWEIRAMANEMLELCKEVAPALFKMAGASCARGPCPEGSRSCKGDGKPVLD